MRTFLKKILYSLPTPFRTLVVWVREMWWSISIRIWEKYTYPNLPKIPSSKRPIKNILIYHINGLTHAGTEKNLQLIANILAKEYSVFFMYGDKVVTPGRAETLAANITLIPFSYDNNEVTVPHRLTGMRPHIKEVVAQHEIDLIITASPGYAHYPWNTINFIPLILLNIFGAPTLQRNILRVIYNSQTTQNHAARWISKSTRDNILYAPLASLPPNHVRELGKKLRHKINISENDFVFGRIGRADNAIFDPIAIHAWKQIAHSYPQAHYLIMSPPPILVSIVEKEKIPRVHFLPPSGKEEDVWAFHGAIDCFAHFRRDGETSGVAIAESLTVGNPVITHKSHIWNAHLEYLSEKCARIAGHDDVAGYATFMSEYIRTQSEDKATWKARCEAAYLVGKKNFSPLNYAKKIYAIVRQLCDKNC